MHQGFTWFHRFKTWFLSFHLDMILFSKTKIERYTDRTLQIFKTKPYTYSVLLNAKHDNKPSTCVVNIQNHFMIQNLMYLNRPYTAEGNTFHTTCGEASLTIDITLSPFIPVDKDYLLVVQFEKKYFLFL